MLKFKFLIFIIIAVITISCNFKTTISPGELAEVHQELEGASNCTQCHVLGKRVSDNKCLECHKDVGNNIDSEKGYHSSEEVSNKKCFDCHSDHHGKDFDIIHIDTNKFDHALTGYKLEDKHSKTNCSQCHSKEFIVDKKIKAKKNTYLGLNQECLTCHDDYHQKTLSKNCLDCHDYKGFEKAKKFDHGKTKYPLIGKHNNVSCEKCHEKTIVNGKDFQRFSGIKYNSCLTCHEDIHKGKLGQNCASCHSENSFKEIKNPKLFNHARTGYILEGKHQVASCNSCHKGKYINHLSHTNCYDCHTDYHKGVFKKNGKLKDCKECHSTSNFGIPQYTIDQHKTTAFPLTGAHIATNCLACHEKNNTWKFRNIGKSCVDCHSNKHKSYISEKYYPKESCETCHNTSKWTQVSFDHSKTGFDLQGVHKQQSCKDCHYKKTKGIAVQRFSTLGKNCVSCHEDIHYKQFDQNGVTNCVKCHGYTNWKANNFNHNNTNFKLDGKHSNLACNKCHFIEKKNNYAVVNYKIKSYLCKDCH